MASLKDCYSRCDVHIPTRHNEYTHPSALPAVLDFASEDGLRGADPTELIDKVNEGDRFGVISPTPSPGDDGKFHLSVKMYDVVADTYVQLRMDHSSVRVFQDPSDPFEYDVFEAFVTHLETVFDADLEPLSPEDVDGD